MTMTDADIAALIADLDRAVQPVLDEIENAHAAALAELLPVLTIDEGALRDLD